MKREEVPTSAPEAVGLSIRSGLNSSARSCHGTSPVMLRTEPPLQPLRVGVVVPAYNEEVTLGQTLESIIKAGIQPEDIHVIDDCSTDRTSSIAANYGVKLIRNQANLGKARSLKLLIFHRKLAMAYDLIALFDADSLIDPCYFSTMLAEIRARPDVALFIGQVKSQRHNWLTSSRAFDYTFIHDVYKSTQSKYSMVTVGPGCASIYRTAALKKIYISDDTLAEDMDWTIQTYRKNLGSTHYVPKAIIYTQDPETLRDYIRQIRRWYRGTWQVIKKHGIPFRISRIDFELGFFCLEGLVFSLFLMLLPLFLPLLLLYHSRLMERIGLSDLLMMSSLALYAAVKNGRRDIFLSFPLFYITRFLNAYIFLESFCHVNMTQEVIHVWNKVKRYPIK
jgi:biofilm PGA synthesis N-glycosyltransferase PgaC